MRDSTAAFPLASSVRCCLFCCSLQDEKPTERPDPVFVLRSRGNLTDRRAKVVIILLWIRTGTCRALPAGMRLQRAAVRRSSSPRSQREMNTCLATALTSSSYSPDLLYRGNEELALRVVSSAPFLFLHSDDAVSVHGRRIWAVGLRRRLPSLFRQAGPTVCWT